MKNTLNRYRKKFDISYSKNHNLAVGMVQTQVGFGEEPDIARCVWVKVRIQTHVTFKP